MLHDEVGRTHTYRLNTEHLAAEPIMALSRLNSTFQSRLGQHLDGWGTTLRYAAVFGSAATGRMTLESDIDLFLVRAADSEDDDAWEQRLTELARLVTAWTGTTAASSSTPRTSSVLRPPQVSRCSMTCRSRG